jgi:hypothetical protein
MTKEIEEYKLKVENLEEEVAHYKENTTNLAKFKDCSFELQEELKTIQKIMYTNLKEFWDHATLFITYFENVEYKKVVLYGVYINMDELQKWKEKEKDSLEYLIRMKKRRINSIMNLCLTVK